MGPTDLDIKEGEQTVSLLITRKSQRLMGQGSANTLMLNISVGVGGIIGQLFFSDDIPGPLQWCAR